ncbi:endonuclease exonuclease phosphatase family protein [Chrysochromulina tobinii]|uniref:Endonuclease exonuclease phosphatase family protein n=1 Tax=Chrysochromulina tobinii TaxID=1460289 RepID=A0A0M0K6F4_9EUKA|nr:endonuclease exonuclease phosphatase family protein [Chrysochromulina tobinii]|eukprot:KOO33948.1 endonuclease exonuclease phosphatase family protein [Chrysochromulina sp. CCMP291]
MALRVGTLNVHRWADARNSGNFERIASLLLPLSLDIVVLQEAGPFTRKPTGGPELAARLGLGHVRVTGDVVLLSRFPLNDRMPLGRQNKRLLLVDVALPMYGSAHSNAFELLCVHLDHRTEEHRLGQLEAVRGATALTAERRGGPLAGSLLLGDLNALTRDDYTAEAWERVAAVRSENGWEPPKCAVTRGAAAARDGSLVGTCRFDTRIDYVYADESFSRNWRLRSCAHVATTATDHKLVIVEFEARRAPGHEGQPPPTPLPAPEKGAAPAQTGAGNPTGGFAAAVHANVDPNALLRMYDTAAPCGTLVVAFAALGGGTAGVARHEFVGACRRCGASHALFVRDARRSWYLLGLGEHGGAALSGREGFDSVVDAVEREVAALRPARVVVVGASMGGYAAIRAGIALRADSVVAFSPQVFIDREERSRLALPPSSFDADLSRVQAGCAQRGMTRLPSAIDALLGSSAVLGAFVA